MSWRVKTGIQASKLVPLSLITARNFVSTSPFFEFTFICPSHCNILFSYLRSLFPAVSFRLKLNSMADETLKDFLRKQARSLDSLLELTPAKIMFGEDVSVSYSPLACFVVNF